MRNLLHECLRSHEDTRCLANQAAQRLRGGVVMVMMVMMVVVHLHLTLVMRLLDQAIGLGSHLGPLDRNDRVRHAGERRRVDQTCKAES
ncbi:MAG: hypothetical protein WA624_17940 [Methylocella sp.]